MGSCERLHPEDVLRINILDDVALAPDGRAVAVTVRTADAGANQYRSNIQIFPTDGSAPWPLTAGSRDLAPAWAPTGDRLAFLSDSSGTTQIWIIEMHGEARRLTSFPFDVAEPPVWSPDGRSLAVVVLQERSDADADSEQDATTIARTCYRVDGRGYLGERYHHIWIVDSRSGAAIPLTSGAGDNYEPAWAPAGDRLVFVANRADERLVEFRSALWVVPAAGGTARRITPANGVALGPAWSPDGRTIAYSGAPATTGYGANHRLLLVPVTGETLPHSVLDTAFEGHVAGSLFSDAWQTGKAALRLRWAQDGHAIYFVAARRGRVHVLTTDLDGNVVTMAGGDRACAMFDLSQDGRTLAYAAADSQHPADLFVTTMGGGGAWQESRALSRLNPWLDEFVLQRPLPFTATSGDGRVIDAWLLPPSGVQEATPGPLVLHIHGGPHSIFGYTFFFDMQLLSTNGYAVLFVNPRATRGYGDDFALCNQGHWGEGDTADLLAALDTVIAQGWVDAGRIGVMGLSYGGYMVNWLIGHTDRFRAAVSENGISSLLSEYGTSDIGWYFVPLELGAEPDQDAARYTRLSPLSAVAQMRAPLLLLSCEHDWRCPTEQAEQLYTALRRRGRVVEMVRFPGESHTMLSGGKPRARVLRRRHLLRWLDRYLAADAAAET